MKILVLTLIFAGLPAGARTAPAQPDLIELKQGDRICLLGNALAERMQHHGWLETRIQSLFPEHELSFRNLGFSADELTVQQRTAGFGSVDDHLTRCRAGVILAFFGFNESFRGAAGLEEFRADLNTFVDARLAQRYDGEHPPRLVLCSSIPFEDLHNRNLPDGAAHNRRIALYNQALADVARDREIPFLDLFDPMARQYAAGKEALTINGIHLTETGNRSLAGVIAKALFPSRRTSLAAGQLERLRQAVLKKNLLWFNRYRATDGYNVYGGRSSLKYTDDVTNFEVLQRELEVLDAMARNQDRRIWALAWGGQSERSDYGVPPLIEVKTNRPGDGPGGARRYLDGREAIDRMTPAPGMKINLFASEAEFPELVNPVQMSFDTRGRLWVATWPTYPHWKPNLPMNDRLLILEDTDGDGRADLCKTFAGNLHNPTGFEFWNGGVVVADVPDLLFLKDTTGDDRADRRERILHGLSSGDTHHSANSMVLGPGGALYFQEGVFHQSQIETIHGPLRNHDACVWRFDPRTFRVDRYVPYNFANPHGHVFDRFGQDFITDGTGNLNYFALPVSGHLPEPKKQRGYFPFFQQRSRPAAATEILSSRAFPEENQGNYLIANVIGFQGLFQYRIEEDRSGFSAREVDPIVFSSDESFRPSDIEVGPDGAIYLLDWHNPLIGHMQHHLRDPSRDHSHGRVYRVTHQDRPLLKPVPIAGRPIDELVDLLRLPEDRVRYRVRIELSARDSQEVVAAARSFTERLDPDDPELQHHLLEALWLQQQHNRLDQKLLVRLLASPEPKVRAAATRVLRYLLDQAERPLELLARQIEDEHPRVRLEALVALSFVPRAEAAEIALRVLERPMDRFLEHALTATLDGLETYWRAELLAGRPLAEHLPAGLARLLKRLSGEELLSVRPQAAVYGELLTRHGLTSAQYLAALNGLAEARGSAPDQELLGAILAADSQHSGQADHLLSGLFGALSELPDGSRERLLEPLRELSTSGLRESTRRLATASWITSEESLELAWRQALGSPGRMSDLLDAAPLIRPIALKRALFPRVLSLLADPTAPARESPAGTRGRYVRIELPGDRRTLTLAEVEVLRGDTDLARGGQASQSSLGSGGHPQRAIDGNHSPLWAQDGQSHTRENQPNPWWELDLGQVRPIDRIVVWNRNEGEGRLSNRLDGFVLRVLDGARRTVYRRRTKTAPLQDRSFELTNPALHLRRAAVRTLPALGVRQATAAQELANRFSDTGLRTAVVEALLEIQPGTWPAETADQLGRQLTRHLAERKDRSFESDEDRKLLALADGLLGRLQPEAAEPLRIARERLGPLVLVIRPVPGNLLYDRDAFSVAAGRTVELVFENTDIMPHNLLIATPGALATVGKAAERMASAPDAWERGYVPGLPEVLEATRLLLPGEAQTLTFQAPEQPGDYPYLCTFPGHWIRMNGIMHVLGRDQTGE